MKVGRALLRVFLILFIGLTVGLSVYSWNAKRMFYNQLPMPFGFGTAVVLSPSMEPALNVNDLVFVRKNDDYKVGDIVVYQSGSILVIHRIIELDAENGVCVTKGDANNVDDGPVPMKDVKGLYMFRLPAVGLIVKALKSLPGTLAVLLAAAFLMIRSWKNEKTESEKKLDDIRKQIEQLKTGDAKASGGDADEAIKAEIARLKAELGHDSGTDAAGPGEDSEKPADGRGQDNNKA